MLFKVIAVVVVEGTCYYVMGHLSIKSIFAITAFNCSRNMTQ